MECKVKSSDLSYMAIILTFISNLFSKIHIKPKWSFLTKGLFIKEYKPEDDYNAMRLKHGGFDDAAFKEACDAAGLDDKEIDRIIYENFTNGYKQNYRVGLKTIEKTISELAYEKYVKDNSEKWTTYFDKYWLHIFKNCMKLYIIASAILIFIIGLGIGFNPIYFSLFSLLTYLGSILFFAILCYFCFIPDDCESTVWHLYDIDPDPDKDDCSGHIGLLRNKYRYWL